MSRTSVHSRRSRAFTLVELMAAVSISTIVFVGMFSAYLFVGRNFTRLANAQQQDAEGRRTLQRFTQDLSAAISLTTAMPTEISLTKRLATGTATVSYAYSAANGTFTRTDSAGTQTLLSGVTGVTLSYFSEAGNPTTTPHSIKSVELLVSSAVGNASGGTRATATAVSPRIVLRNKAALQ
jgi:prepilin-type N-terminal cleavage/methylation domain-containing protein